uniref:Skp1-related protein n=1 Tax=Ascaris suum TaxID=6253 RepID=F1LDQ3_ASCSU
MNNAEGSRMVALRSSDGMTLLATRGAMRLSNTINMMLENLGIDCDGVTEKEIGPVPLSELDAFSLRKVIEWCEHHHSDMECDKNSANKSSSYEDFSDWDKHFLDVTNEELIRIVNAANFLDIDALMQMLAIKVAGMITGKKVEEVRAMFGIVNDFTPEEEEQIRLETAWVEDPAN